jgi:hypothetical protein
MSKSAKTSPFDEKRLKNKGRNGHIEKPALSKMSATEKKTRGKCFYHSSKKGGIVSYVPLNRSNKEQNTRYLNNLSI